MKITAAAVGVLVLTLGLGWILVGNNLALMRVFAPRFEQVRRETFEQSKAYRQGMIQEIQNMAFQYAQADPEAKKALASIILHRTADFEEDDMPPDLRDFVQKLRHERMATR